MKKPPPYPCPQFSACWCETRPNNPNCKDALLLNNNSLVLIFIILISIFMFIKFNLKNDNEK